MGCFNDLLEIGSSLDKIEGFKVLMKNEFEMTYMGELSYFLGMKYFHTDFGIVMHRQKYAIFNMNQCNSIKSPLEANVKLKVDEAEEAVDETLYKQMVGSLRFLCNSRPELAFSVGLVSRFMNKPRKSHMVAVKRILRYVKVQQMWEFCFLLT